MLPIRISHWVMLETGCDVIPRNTPFAMNPEALEKKRYQDRLAALERQIGSNGAGRSNQSNNQNGGGNNGAARPPSNATSDAAAKKMRSNANVASVTSVMPPRRDPSSRTPRKAQSQQLPFSLVMTSPLPKCIVSIFTWLERSALGTTVPIATLP